MHKYFSAVVGDDYRHWGNAKVFINAPTGAGKTTFILKELLPYYRNARPFKRNLLILCNRRMLHEQYDASLATHYSSYLDYDNVKIMSYQQLAKLNKDEIYKIQQDFYGICLDECHYFVQDSDFSSETYEVWKLITGKFYSKQLIFVSATMECLRPFIDEFKEKIPHNSPMHQNEHYRTFIDVDRYTIKADYSYFDLIGVPNQHALCEKIVSDNGKALIFINSHDGASKLKQMLEDRGLPTKAVKILNANELDRQDELRECLVYGEKFPEETKVLITTSVLDNGVSLTDSEISSITVFTSSKTDFIQMIGRVRVQPGDTRRLKLYLVERSASEFKMKKMCLEEDVKIIEECERCVKKTGSSELPVCFNEVLENTRRGEVLRKICFHKEYGAVVGNSQYVGSCKVYLNPMSCHKIRQNCHEVQAAFKESKIDKRYLPNLQAAWLGYTSDDIIWEEEGMAEHKLQSFILEAMQEKIDNQRFQEVKKNTVEISAQYKIGKKYGFRNDRVPETAKFEKLCEDLSLIFTKGTENGQTWYKVSEGGDGL